MLTTSARPHLCPSSFSQALTDKVIGLSMLIVALVVFVYYTMWAIVTVRRVAAGEERALHVFQERRVASRHDRLEVKPSAPLTLPHARPFLL